MGKGGKTIRRAIWVDTKPVPDGFWRDKNNRVSYMRWLEGALRFKKPEDWFNVTKRAFRENRGLGFLACNYGDSPIAAVREYKPDLAHCEWLFKSVPQGFWNDADNRRRYLEWLAEKLGFERLEDWYRITGRTLTENHGGRLLHGYYGSSVIRLLRDNFPDYEWLEWKLRSTPTNFWKKRANRLRYLEWLGGELGFERIEDYAKLRRTDFVNNHGEWLLLTRYGNSVKKAVAEYRKSRPSS